MSQLNVRINGKGNAWPVILGQDHPFYNRSNLEELANASCSIIKSEHDNINVHNIEWEVMIDAGHGAVQYLLKNCNRIPDALCITHPHIDHTLGIDWIIQSYYKTCKKQYPVYCTALCWERTLTSFPHLKEMVNFKELIPFKEKEVTEADHLTVIPFPVYHGQSAVGAVMLNFKYNEESKSKKMLFSGDILCPILRKDDYSYLHDLDLFIADANNRFPYPKSNHWSILNGINGIDSDILKYFKKEITLANILYPHIHNCSFNYSRCFDYFFNRDERIHEFLFSISDFLKLFKPQKTILMHYSGSEDEKYYSKSRLAYDELNQWLGEVQTENNLESELIVASIGQCIKL